MLDDLLMVYLLKQNRFLDRQQKDDMLIVLMKLDLQITFQSQVSVAFISL